MARGSIKQRSKGSWFIRVELEPDPATGRRRQKVETFRGSKHAAEDRMNELLSAARRGAIGNAGRLTLGDYLDRWLSEHAAAHLAPKTHRGYRQLVDLQIRPLIGGVPLEKLRPAHLLDFKSKLRELPRRVRPRKEGEAPPPLPISTRTQRATYRVLHTALEHAVAWNLIAANPASSIPAPLMRTAEMRPFTAEQAGAFVAAAHTQGLAWQAFFGVALNTGMRLALRWSDVDLDTGVIRVHQTIAYVSGHGSQEKGTKGLVVKPPKTNAGRRSIAIGPDMVVLLRRHRAEQEEHRLRMAPEWKDRGLVFPSGVGTPIGDDKVRQAFARICAAAEAPVIRIHDLRHTCATLMLLADVNIKAVSERLGHATVARHRRDHDADLRPRPARNAGGGHQRARGALRVAPVSRGA